MAFRIDNRFRLLDDGRPVERIMAPASHTAGPFVRQPTILVMHFTYGASARSSANWFRDPANPYKSSAHVVVERDGSVIQCVDFNVAAHHAGKSSLGAINGLNRHSFGIELANWGYLQKKGSNWVSYTGVVISDPVLAVHENGNPNNVRGPIGWEPYSPQQMKAAVEIARLLVGAYGVDTIVGHDDISVGWKWDPGPAFDMSEFRVRVLDDRSSDAPNRIRANTPGDTLNLRKGPGIAFDAIQTLADGTLMVPLEHEGAWVLVNVLDANGTAVKSGYVYRRLTLPV